MIKNYFIFLFAIITLGGLFIFLNRVLENNQESTKKDIAVKPTVSRTQDFISNDSRIVISIPSSWHVVDTTPVGTSGQFGPYVQTWTVSNYVLKDVPSNTVSDNNVKIDFVIQEGGGNLPIDSLLDCSIGTCETIGIDSEQFIKRTATSPIGEKSIAVATFYDQNVLTVTASIMPGDKQAQNVATVEKILQSITFKTKDNN